jgi:hypothetical protein
MRHALAMAMLLGCGSTGGKLGAAGAVVFGVGAVATFNLCWSVTITTDDGTYRDSCPSDVAFGVLAVAAVAAAITGLGFELEHVAKGDAPVGRPKTTPPPVHVPPAQHEFPPALSYAEARELVRRFVVARELGLDGRDASSHFDRESGAWFFEWDAGAGGVTLGVDISKRVTGTRCAPSDAHDCTAIP